jgi:hypothetical protein
MRTPENVVRTIEMESGGIEIVMHERACVNCARLFKVITTSTQMTCSKPCQIEAELDPAKRKLAVKQLATLKQKTKPDPRFYKPAPSKAPTPPQVVKPLTPLQELEANWKRYVTEARQYVTSMNGHRLHIASLAIQACDIQHGGGAHWSDFKDVYTLKKFAEEIGVTYKTLHGWCRVKTNVIDKLPAGEYDDKTDWCAARAAAGKSAKGDSAEKVRSDFQKWKRRGSQDHYLLQLNRRVKSGAYFIHNRADLAKLDDAILKELKNNAQSIVNDINKFYRSEK